MTHAFDINDLANGQKTHSGNKDLRFVYFQEIHPELEKSINCAIIDAFGSKSFAAVGRYTIETIHAVPRLYGVDGSQVEFYLGRAGATTKHVLQRLFDHFANKHHEGAIVLARCQTSTALKWEDVAVKILNNLRDRNKLCVANIACSSVGRIPKTEESIIYLTWKILKVPARISLVKRNDIQSIAESVAENINSRIKCSTIINALDPISRPKQAYNKDLKKAQVLSL